jgi:hypothetical protein
VFLGRAVGPCDPLWLPADRDKALWWAIHEAERCPSCGFARREFDPAEGGDPHAWEWEGWHCRGCEIRAQGDEWLEKNRKNLRRGTHIRLRPTPPAEEPPDA